MVLQCVSLDIVTVVVGAVGSCLGLGIVDLLISLQSPISRQSALYVLE